MTFYPLARAVYRAAVPPVIQRLVDQTRLDHLNRQRVVRFNEYGALLIHVPKTGGASISAALYPEDIGRHTRAAEYVRVARFAFAAANSFSVVRDPWNRCASAYRFLMNGGGVGVGARRIVAGRAHRDQLLRFTTFEMFVEEWIATADLYSGDPVLCPQHHYICDDETGKVLVKWVGRTERMNEVEDYLSTLFRRPVSIPKINTSGPTADYRALYTERMADIVGAAYRRDAELFGYSW